MGHYMAIIVKDKMIEAIKARSLVGERLVNHDVADYYDDEDSTYVVSGYKPVATLEEFLETYEDNFGRFTPVAFFVVRCEDDYSYVDGEIIPSEFYEFYEQKYEREELLKLYKEVFHKQVVNDIKRLLQEDSDFEVISMDYHF